MKTIRLATSTLVFLGAASLANHVSAQTVVTEWNFNNNTVAVNTSPATSTGSGTASTIGMNNTSAVPAGSPAPTMPTVDTSDVNTSTPLSSDPGTGGVNTQWRIRGGDGTASPGAATNAWSSTTAIGSQGAQFLSSTVGYNNIRVSFDWSPTGQGEGKLQVQYTLNGSTYFNVPVNLFTSFGTGATATGMTNTTSTNTVMGGYLLSGSTTAYMNGITLSLSGIAGANNDPNFGVRLVSASTGADDTNTAGTALNNTSGNWRFDEVTIAGTPAVPEPSASVLTCLGLLGLGVFARRRLAVQAGI